LKLTVSTHKILHYLKTESLRFVADPFLSRWVSPGQLFVANIASTFAFTLLISTPLKHTLMALVLIILGVVKAFSGLNEVIETAELVGFRKSTTEQY